MISTRLKYYDLVLLLILSFNFNWENKGNERWFSLAKISKPGISLKMHRYFHAVFSNFNSLLSVCKCDETLCLVFNKLGSISKIRQQPQRKRHQTNCLMCSTRQEGNICKVAGFRSRKQEATRSISTWTTPPWMGCKSIAGFLHPQYHFEAALSKGTT